MYDTRSAELGNGENKKRRLHFLHVHIYRDGVMVAKFDLEGWEVMAGNIDRRLRQILKQLREEQRL